MQYAKITDDAPPMAQRTNGDTEAVPVSDWPDGMTLAVDDVVLVESIGSGPGKSVVVVQRMASTP